MKFIRQYLFESLVILILSYILIFSVIFRSVDFGSKLVIFSLSFFIIIAVVIIRYSFGKELTIESIKILQHFSADKKPRNPTIKFILIISASLFIFLLVSLIDIFVYVVQTGKNPVAFGFPVIIYSFVQRRFLSVGLAFNVFLFAAVLYFLAKIFSNRDT